MTGGYVCVRPSVDDLKYVRPNSSGYAFEHRLVMGRALGRCLEPWETVHHIDGDRTNNEIDNLQLRQGHHGSGVVYTCRDCGSHNVATRRIGSEQDAT